MCSLVVNACVLAFSDNAAFVELGLVLGVCDLTNPSDEIYFAGVFLALGFGDLGFQHNYLILSMMYILCYSTGLILHISMILSCFVYQYYE
jgi:hypothetical protein